MTPGGLVSLIPINSRFLIYDLGLPGLLPAVQQTLSPIAASLLSFVLPALVVGTTYLSQKFMTMPSADPSQASMTRQMNLIMPMMFGLFALQFASGLSIYFIVSNVVGAGQGWLVNQRWQKTPLLPAAASTSSKASKPVASHEVSGNGKKALPAKSGAVNTGKSNKITSKPGQSVSSKKKK